ncbi:hypothetical protein [Virgibacillus halodenitrificans]|uniref:hypothetical protein n=1 Tax=Virgibacillus halodenitrificans TaxID=1482 RepID=UPI000EF53738|nr:hypothetical protein [Virgibacillus halodenitrificans]MYL57616.1 hypothetical protein [Virgibacillus halodenitrificans]
MQKKQLVPRISFKGVFIFMIMVLGSLLILNPPLQSIGLSAVMSYFIATSLGASIGSMVVLLKIDAKKEDKPLFMKRIILSLIIGITSSALMTFVFGGDLIG